MVALVDSQVFEVALVFDDEEFDVVSDVWLLKALDLRVFFVGLLQELTVNKPAKVIARQI